MVELMDYHFEFDVKGLNAQDAKRLYDALINVCQTLVPNVKGDSSFIFEQSGAPNSSASVPLDAVFKKDQRPQ